MTMKSTTFHVLWSPVLWSSTGQVITVNEMKVVGSYDIDGNVINKSDISRGFDMYLEHNRERISKEYGRGKISCVKVYESFHIYDSSVYSD